MWIEDKVSKTTALGHAALFKDPNICTLSIRIKVSTLKMFTFLEILNHHTVNNKISHIPTKNSFDRLKMNVDVYFGQPKIKNLDN